MRYKDRTKFTQEEKVLMHLKHFGTITPMEAIQDYGITRLAAKIHLLKKMGEPIGKIIEIGTNRFGERAHWAKYFYGKEVDS